jgi:uncharacterized protein
LAGVTKTVRGLYLTRIFAFLLAAGGVLAATACAKELPHVVLAEPGGHQIAAVRVEVADTNVKREVGLMYRKHLDPDAGMVFIFQQPQYLTFWMKNTEIPLDMIFADTSGRIVGIIRNATPFSVELLHVDQMSQFVLEVNGGFCERNGVVPGDYVRFVGFVPHAID